jgi:hypothetical protein
MRGSSMSGKVLIGAMSWGALVLGLAAAGCGDDGKLPLGATCDSPEACESGACVDGRCVMPVDDEGSGLCPGLRKCLDGCARKEDVADCSQGCFATASNETELMLADNVSVCNWESCGEPSGSADTEAWRAFFTCQRTSCVSELALCHSGGAWGNDASCASFGACMSACGGVALCERDCATGATDTAVRAWFDLNRCELSVCTGVAAAEQDACVTASHGPDGACGQAYTTCLGEGGGE